MIPIQGTGAFRPVGAAAARPAARSGGFSVGGSPAAAAGGAVAETSLSGLLALQEAGSGVVQDREARRHGHDLLAQLSALQRDLLAGPPDAACLSRLASLAACVPEAADPGLRDIVAEIALRARIEIVRYSNV